MTSRQRISFKSLSQNDGKIINAEESLKNLFKITETVDEAIEYIATFDQRLAP